MNPVVELYERPVATLTDAAFISLLLGALVLTWWAAGRNLLYLSDNYQTGWRYLVPFWYAVRMSALFGIVAIDLALIGAIIHVLLA